MAAKPKKATKKKAASKKVASKKVASKKVKVSSKARRAKPAANKMARPKAAKAKVKAAKPRAAAAPANPYHTVTPHLTLEDAGAAIAFYRQAFGAQERYRMPGPDGKIAHAEIMIGDSIVMLSDAGDQRPATSSSLHVYVPDCDALWSQAIAAGASVKTPLEDMFWGDRFGTITDPFGNSWNIATHREDVSPEEMMKRMAALPPPDGPQPASA
jgi:uncharacterized glyoxalase superfamily protein PhnB